MLLRFRLPVLFPASCLALLCAALLPASAHAAPTLSASVLRGRDVPGYTALSSSVEAFQNDQDQGTLQALSQCARGITLFEDFDSGSDSLDSTVYGRGTNPFGTPRLIIGSIGFDDGSVNDAGVVLDALQDFHFRDCWANTSDELNRQQGETVPTRPSRVASLAHPILGSQSTAFSIDSVYSGFGAVVHSDVSVLALQVGRVAVMLIGEGYDQPVPGHVLDHAAAAIAASLKARR